MIKTKIHSVTGKEYDNYSNAMIKNGCMPLDADRYADHVEDNCETYEYKNSYLHGNLIDGIFFPSHFAPESMRDGVKLLKKLLDDSQKVIFAVLPEMADMLEKIGYIQGGWIMVDYPYPQEKRIMVNHIGMIDNYL